MKKFKYFNHTADIGLEAYGGETKEVFENAARGLFNLIVEPGEVELKEEVEVRVEAGDIEALLVEWLNELLYLFETKKMVFKDFQIEEISETALKAKAKGEKVKSNHEIKTQIKACTYHLLKVEKKNKTWHAKVIFDV